ncbi:hypothetical protein [Janthinobacterium aquaticum]|uniref:hypothetical protein n=1 Tax=Janthinobacterium sp. FT58W TaxID=2654254 RepID=UPI00126585E3|nr:hypothetical protein [Janthinobacterium sp. FT58W]KAB8041684.1 hypothetical protein GCM43_17885 [Janthinobacterium sp. FT58W]
MVQLKARAEWISFELADDARVDAVWRARLAPVRSRVLLSGGLVLILLMVVQAVWRDVSYAGTAVLLCVPVMAAWIVLLFAWPAPGLAFHVALDRRGLLLQRQARRLPGCGRSVRIEASELLRLELIRHPGAQRVYKGSGPLARLELRLVTSVPGLPLIRVVGMDLQWAQRWSLQQLAQALAAQCAQAGVPVEHRYGAPDQRPEQIRAAWLVNSK